MRRLPPRCHLTRFRFQNDTCSLAHFQTVLRVHEQGLLERCPADFVVSAMHMTAIAATGTAYWLARRERPDTEESWAVPGLTLGARGVPSPRAKTAHTVRAKDVQENENVF